ncbi:MAG: DUF2752 domain-containing protein [Bacteroidales bacterium]|nr:DUF2752 domain-containing protein [Bacteroidales bacterium]MBN2749114.1 DUF2752 domain-containing protein [Bacteroidales bacterium]
MEVGLTRWNVIEREERLTVFGYLLYTAIIGSCLLTLSYPFFDAINGSFSCIFHSITGIPCPTCGYTRALMNVFDGNLLESFFYSPLWVVFVFYQLALVFLSIKSIFLSKALLFKSLYVKLFIALLAVNWILKFIIGASFF